MNRSAYILTFMFGMLSSFQSWSQQQEIIHPGLLVNLKQLDYVRNNLDKEPWKSAYTQTLKSPFAKIDYHPKAWETVECGSSSNPNHGCTDETNDAKAAYTQALLWRYTNNPQYAENVRSILNAWANTLKGGHTNSNAPLQAAWSAELFTRAAEIVKYTYTGWPQPEKDKVTKMFVEQYLPDVKRMFTQSEYKCYNKNWHASGIEAMLNVAIFNKNITLFNEAISKWRDLVPSYIYLESDGRRPRDASWCPRSDQQIITHWQGQSHFVDGLTQETCRDFDHTAYGLAAIINAAESARLQGVDLYSEQEERITKAMEFHSKYQNGEVVPSWLCGGVVKGGTRGTFEIGYNQYAMRERLKLPETGIYLEKTRPTVGQFHYLWETLTHGLTGVTH